MIAVLSLLSLASGGGLAWAASRVPGAGAEAVLAGAPDRAARLERLSGTLLVAGLGLVGAGLHAIAP